MSYLNFLFTDFYELNMAYSYWKNGTHDNSATFALYYRKNPFNGEFAIFCGVNRFLEYLQNFKVTVEDVEFIKSNMPSYVEEGFYDYLINLTLENVDIYAITEGTVVFPNIPLVQLCGPIAILSLFETLLLNLTNYASLVATNAVYFRMAAGDKVLLSEFGCRRAQGPDGAISASLYSYIGGFDSTSNTLASKIYGIPLNGTVAHSFISSFAHSSSKCISPTSNKMSDLSENLLKISSLKLAELIEHKIIETDNHSIAELNAFVGYASSFPTKFIAIIDTYNVVCSGLPNFCAVALALHELGYRALGVRIDSGDLSYLSKYCRECFNKISKHYNYEWFSELTIVASNEITVEVITSLNIEKHEINVMGIGTNLVTCSAQSSLGMVYKLTEHENLPTMKRSEDIEKISIPFRKRVYRLYNRDHQAIFDLLTLWDEKPPAENQRVFCFHHQRSDICAYAVPSKVVELQQLVFSKNRIVGTIPSIEDTKKYLKNSLLSIRSDHIRILNPTPFKVSISEKLHDAFHDLIRLLPVKEIA